MMMKRAVFRQKGRWAIGIDLGGTKTIVGQVDGQGKVRRKLLLPTNAPKGPASVKQAIASAVQTLLKDAGSLPAGIGVGVAGQVDAQKGAVFFAPNLGWRDEPLREDLARATGLPVRVENDVRAATRGEWLYGAGRGCNDLICLFVGTGIGGGVVSGGRLLAGCSNTAGELGHITIDLNGPGRGMGHCPAGPGVGDLRPGGRAIYPQNGGRTTGEDHGKDHGRCRQGRRSAGTLSF
jgi:glucokinase